MNIEKIEKHLALLKKMQEAGGVNNKPTTDILEEVICFLDAQKYVIQVGQLVLEDSDGLCVVSSDITCGGDKDNCFEITNAETQRKYQISVKIEEI